jgi:predicted lipoprotein with Yx(FWY)xxD motif
MASESSATGRGRGDHGFIRVPIGRLARRAAPSGLAAIAVAGLLTACGSAGTTGHPAAGGSGAGGSGAAAPGTTAPRGTVVSARKLPGVGTVLVGRYGKTLYSPQQEAGGKIRCTGGCLGFWFPVQVAAGAALQAPSGVTGVLGMIHRPDGLTQLTYNGKPLYTFRLDQAPGQAHGNDFTDHFGGTTFTWHAVTTSGAPAGTGQQGSTGGYTSPNGAAGY